MNSKSPNFFLVGGPKCGTTAMVEYLRTHPDIFISEPKEPNFFADDMPKMKYVDSLKAYLNLFNKVKHEKVIGDASIFYMFSNINKFHITILIIYPRSYRRFGKSFPSIFFTNFNMFKSIPFMKVSVEYTSNIFLGNYII